MHRCWFSGFENTRLLGGGPGSESLCDDTTDNRNVVADTLDEDDDDKESNHGVMKVVVELYFRSIQGNIINSDADNSLVWQ